MIAFIDENRDEYGVEPICRTLSIAPSTYHEHQAPRRRPERAPPRLVRDDALRPEIERVFYENFQVYGVRKVWRQLLREGVRIARCTVARLMKSMGLKGVIRGKPHRTTYSDKAAPCPLDRVKSAPPILATGVVDPFRSALLLHQVRLGFAESCRRDAWTDRAAPRNIGVLGSRLN